MLFGIFRGIQAIEFCGVQIYHMEIGSYYLKVQYRTLAENKGAREHTQELSVSLLDRSADNLGIWVNLYSLSRGCLTNTGLFGNLEDA